MRTRTKEQAQALAELRRRSDRRFLAMRVVELQDAVNDLRAAAVDAADALTAGELSALKLACDNAWAALVDGRPPVRRRGS